MAQTRAWSLNYLHQKVFAGALELVTQLNKSSPVTVPEAFAKAVEAYHRQFTSVIVLAGAAMAPTLNTKATQNPEAVEKLLVRLIPHPGPRQVLTGDVVAFKTPFAASETAPVIIRRVAAMEGDELITDDDTEPEEYVIPKNHCWVLADNESLAPPHVIDSRAFGPLPLSNIVGRVLYAAANESDHGPVENNEMSMAADACIIEAELDLDRLLSNDDASGGDERATTDGNNS